MLSALRSVGACLVAAIALQATACAAPASDADETEASGAAQAASVGTRKAVQVTQPELHAWMRELWGRSMTAEGAKRIECASVVELPGAHLCAAATSYSTNKALVRASIYTEGGFGNPRGTVPAHDDEATQRAMGGAVGHDLRSEHLLAFWRDAKEACATKGKAYCPSAEEKALFEGYVLPNTRSGRAMVLLAFPATSVDTTGSHELRHAQYFLTPAYRAVTDRFWKETVTEEDKAKVRELLGSYYDVNDVELLANEFMAYVLARGVEYSFLAELVPVYAPRLRQALEAAGALPLELAPGP